MTPTKFSFDPYWNERLVPTAMKLGAIDGDLPRIRTAVKNTLITSGWANVHEMVEVTSLNDYNACLKAALDTVARVTPNLVASRTVVKKTAGMAPTKAALSASAQPQSVVLQSTQHIAASFPTTAHAGQTCPRCNSIMSAVTLANDQGAVYCRRDRVVLPLPSDHAVRTRPCSRSVVVNASPQTLSAATPAPASEEVVPNHPPTTSARSWLRAAPAPAR